MDENKFLNFDVCILGSGSGSIELAKEMVSSGKSVCVVKDSESIFDNSQVIVKSLNYSACVLSEAGNASKFNGGKYSPKANFKKIKKYAQDKIKELSAFNSEEKLKKLGIKFLEGKGEFINPNDFQLDEKVIKAKNFVIAKNSKDHVPQIKGLSKCNFLLAENLLEMDEVPKKIVIIGASFKGIEIAFALKKLGAQVILIDSGLVLKKIENESRSFIKHELKNAGVQLYENAKILSCVEEDGVKKVEMLSQLQNKEFIETDYLLITTGSKAKIQDLALEQAKVAFTQKGITVDDKLQSFNKKIYAIGCSNGSLNFPSVAKKQAMIVAYNINSNFFKKKYSQKMNAWGLSVSPEVAFIGLEDKYLKGKDYKTLKFKFDSNEKSVLEGQSKGFVKVNVLDKGKDRGKVLNVIIISKNAAELILPWSVLIENNMNISKMKNLIQAYPSRSSIVQSICDSYNPHQVCFEKLKNMLRFKKK